MARNAVRSNIEHLVYDRIHRAILEQRLPPRPKLGEASLRSHFPGSRARARRILLRLAHDQSGEFHLLLAHVAGNRVLTWFLRELVARTSLIIAVYEGPGSSCCAYDEHRALLAPLEAGRVQDAVYVMTRHLQGIEGRLNLDRT